MKQKTRLNLLGVVSAIMGVIFLITTSIYLYVNKPYTEIINLNWSISLPEPCKEIYSTDSGSSFNGDGERYSIFEYENIEDVNLSLKWDNNENEVVDLAIMKVLQSEIMGFIKVLSIPLDNMPNFKSQYRYFRKWKSDSSKLYLIFVPDTKLLYVIEHFQ
ncbi:hypothetical protein [Clostridium sp.]|jgi:hypothetical protein|uniref:hypothetical protein n=1 Tax=Clostridium sp. TaxID=1506 RepID=UPI003EEAE073